MTTNALRDVSALVTKAANVEGFLSNNDQSCSSYGGIERFELSRHGASLLFEARPNGLRGLKSADIRFQIGDREFEHLHNQLMKVFSGTSVYERIDV